MCGSVRYFESQNNLCLVIFRVYIYMDVSGSPMSGSTVKVKVKVKLSLSMP